MDIRKAASEDGVKWYLSGNIDEDSLLQLESLILNSGDLVDNVTLDVSGLEQLPTIGARGIANISRKLSSSGSCVEIAGANENVSRSLRYSGLMED